MAFIPSPRQLDLLKKVVDGYCRDCGIVDTDQRLYVVELTSALLSLGVMDIRELRRQLEAAMGSCLPLSRRPAKTDSGPIPK